MQALVLAAGLGTRLKPLTERVPKALVEIAGRTLLEHVVGRLATAGVTRVVVNVHHHAERIEAFVRARGGLGVEVVFSHEVERPLETGGALRAAAPLLAGEEPFFVHNVDVLTDLPLDALYRAHARRDPLATLAVMERPTSRHLLFDDRGLLGRDDLARGIDERVRPAVGLVQALGFAGVHVAAPRLLGLIEEEGAFPVLRPWLRLAAAGHAILPFRVDGARWIDVGRPESLAAARRQAP